MTMQQVMSQFFIQKYLTETGLKESCGIQEARLVVECAMDWWNHKLNSEERQRIEKLSPTEQKKVFMGADVDLLEISELKFCVTLKDDLNEPCPCGSGKKFGQCCHCLVSFDFVLSK